MRIKLIFSLTGLVLAGSAWANPYFVDNPYSPIPSSCFTVAHDSPLAAAVLNGNSALVWKGHIELNSTIDPVFVDLPQSGQYTLANLRVYRLGCAEPGRSALVADFTVPDGVDQARYVLPSFNRQYWGDVGPEFITPSEPGEWKWDSGRDPIDPATWEENIARSREGIQAFGDFRYGHSYDGMGWFGWSFILDLGDVPTTWWDPGPDSAKKYNDSFDLMIWGARTLGLRIPATTNVLEPNLALPLNGRLSGTWVIGGARDQGLVLSFSNRVSSTHVPEESPVFLFLSWFTFDQDGNMLWLTGAAEVAQGDTRAVVPILLTGGGEFMGTRNAIRSIVGQVVLSAKSCNDLQFEYELSSLSLGQGTKRLERLEGMEVAGYNCRDYEARQESVTEGP